MDNLTHTLAGVTLGNGLKPRSWHNSRMVLALIVGSNFPDIDFFFSKITGIESFLVRRQLTHSLVMLPVFAVLLGYLHSRFFKPSSFKSMSLVYFFAMLFHIFLDLVNSYGVCLFFPFSRYRFELSWMFIIDLWVWLILGVTFLIAGFVKWRDKRETIPFVFKSGSVVLLSYLFLCGFLHFKACALLEKWVQEKKASFSYVFPEVFRPDWRRGVVRLWDHRWEVYFIDLSRNRLFLKEVVRSELDDPLVQKVRRSRVGKEIEWFFKAPVWKRIDERTVQCYDLRFRSVVLKPRRRVFVYRFQITEDGRILRHRLRL